ncbi:MAG TPA: aminotransferase class V-fold PLP-dependent enzyme [Bryobacteraceae bacterium]|jgi:selenocysteine lyase/cysteine desulfurase|nr:aminotransferase class V-fold PLP-dependent enzyme [Bryobacteraceae bacterium]
MGFEIHEQYRDQFPVTESLIYLNHAAVAPLCKPAADAMKHLAEDALRFGSLHYDRWMAAYEGVRLAAARLIGSSAREIAIVKNTSEGIAMVATGIDWKKGDRVVAFREEFPANYLPWKKLEELGVGINWLSVQDPLERMDEACRGARLLAISHVQYLSGYRVDLNAIGEICHRRGCFFFVDAIQGLGAFPLDVEQAHIDALSADSHKWLLGPEGCGILYVRQSRQDEVRPVEFGWTNVANYSDYASRDMKLRPDAGRYECGTLNTIGCFGVQAALEFLLEVGVSNIAPAIQALGDRLADGVLAKGYEVLGCRTPATGAGIVSFRHPAKDSHVLVKRLKERGMIAAPRQGWVRMAPHFYIRPDEIDQVLDEL